MKGDISQNILYLSIISAIIYIVRIIITDLKPLEKNIRTMIKDFFKILPAGGMMILMAIPEQLVLYNMEPNMAIEKRLMVSIAMYVIHFAWNGFVMKPERSYNEIVWIIGTSLYALQVIGVKKSTAIALVAADSLLTLSMRGL